MFILGVDVGKAELAVSLQFSRHGEAPQPMGGIQMVANNAAGLNKLVRWVEKQLASQNLSQNATLDQLHVVMEATNVYWEKCAHHFHALDCRVSVVNPAQVKFFSKTTLRRGKTDSMDAEIIARFGLTMQPEMWTPPQPAWIEIKQLVREREAVLQQLSRERNHLQALQHTHHTAPLAVRLIRQRIRLLERQTQILEAALKQAFAQDEALQAQLELLMSVPGFGFIAAATVLAETTGFATLGSGDQISAYSGLAPAPHQSGQTNRKGSISKIGNARLRRIAYMAALGAKLSHSPFKAFYESLRERGKPPKVALVALARKLLRVGLAVVKSGQPYQPSYLKAVPETAP